MGLRCQSSASIRHPRFLLFPLLEKGLSKKGKDRSDVSDFILKGATYYAERFVGFAYNVYFWPSSKVVTLDNPNEFGTLRSLLRPFTIQKYCAFLPRKWKGRTMYLKLRTIFYLHIVFVPQMQPWKYSLTYFIIIGGIKHCNIIVWKGKLLLKPKQAVKQCYSWYNVKFWGNKSGFSCDCLVF